VPKKQKRVEAEFHAMIVRDSKMRLGCKEAVATARRKFDIAWQ
jgi:hypothetical protein